MCLHVHTSQRFPSGWPVAVQYPEVGPPFHSGCPEPPSPPSGWTELMQTGSEHLRGGKKASLLFECSSEFK